MPAKPLALLTTTAPRGARPALSYAAPLEAAGYEVEQWAIPEASNLRQLACAWKLGHRIRRYRLIVANEYSTAVALGILAIVFRAKARMVVLSLNLSRRPLRFPVFPLQKLINSGLRRYDAIVVHSQPEVGCFVELHGLNPHQFRVVPWGFDLPSFDSSDFPGLPTRYVCLIGRNNRDFRTAAEALAGTGVSGVFVGADACQHRRPDICAFKSLPFPDCLKIMRGALANLILVRDTSRGAGHITAVAGMLLGKPHIYSDVPTLTPYLKNGRHGLAVPLNDAGAVRAAVTRLASDPDLVTQFGRAARHHARSELSHARFLDRILAIILAKTS